MNLFSLSITAFIAGLLVSGCSERIADGGSGAATTNGISGIIRDSDGHAVADARVLLLTEDHNPYKEPTLPKRSAMWMKRTDDKGWFRFDSVSPGTYNIQSSHPDNETAVLLKGITVTEDEGADSLEGTLREPGTIIVHLLERGVTEGDYIYIPGTSIFKDIDAAAIDAGMVHIGGIPPAVYEEVLLVKNGELPGTNLIRESTTVTEGGTASIGPYSTWSTRMKIIINTSSTGANITEDVYGFPLLVRLGGTVHEPSLQMVQQGDGSDLRFTKSDGTTPLPYEIEHWDAAGGEASIWVKMDTIFRNNESQHIYMYTGNANASSSAKASEDTPAYVNNGPAVFGANQDYQGVWHLNQDPGGIAPQMSDASEKGNHGTVRRNMDAGNSVSGLVGSGITFSDSGQHITTPETSADPDLFSISIWFRTSDTIGGELVGFDYQDTAHYHDRHVWLDDSGHVYFGVFPLVPDSVSPEDSALIEYGRDTTEASSHLFPGIRRTVASPEAYNDGTWHNATAVLSLQGQLLYVDGILVDENPVVTSGQDYTGSWKLGYSMNSHWEGAYTGNYFPGVIDEARVMYRELSENWIKMCYETQKENSTVVRIED